MKCYRCDALYLTLTDFSLHWRLQHATIAKYTNEQGLDVYGFNCVCGQIFQSTYDMARHLERLKDETVDDHFVAEGILDALDALDQPSRVDKYGRPRIRGK